jgi:hypothetical protein
MREPNLYILDPISIDRPNIFYEVLQDVSDEVSKI